MVFEKPPPGFMEVLLADLFEINGHTTKASFNSFEFNGE
jgi:hypothetical protein